MWIPSVICNEKALIDFLFNPCKCQCGLPNRSDRLLGGEVLKKHEFPWLGTIETPKGNIIGTLVNDKYVITAASEVMGLSPNEITIIFGYTDKCLENASHISVVNVNVNSIIMHPEFNPQTHLNNLALIRLSTQIKIDRELSPICLAKSGLTYTGQVATVSGWSKLDKNASVPGCMLRKLGVPVLGKEECSSLIAKSNISGITDKGCLGIYGFPNPVCKSETGGPVMYRSYKGVYELIGVLSNVNECNNEPSVAVFTRIGDHLSWITEATKDACYCFNFYY